MKGGRRQEPQDVQVFVKVDGARTSTMEMALSDKVNDIVERTPTSACATDVTCT